MNDESSSGQVDKTQTTLGAGLLIDGKQAAARVLDAVREVFQFQSGVQQDPCFGNRTSREQGWGKPKTVPGLAAILVGNDPASHIYVNLKQKQARDLGFRSEVHRFEANVPELEVRSLIAALNQDPHVHGILLQLPLPRHWNVRALLDMLATEKDVDGLGRDNVAALALNRPGLIPCTPLGCWHLIRQTLGDVTGRHVVMVGRSLLVGRSLAQLLLNHHATVTMVHSRTRLDMAQSLARDADVVVSAVGSPGLVTAAWVGPQSVVIDVGITRCEDGVLRGDVDFEAVRSRVRAITPVPGGVGPMTRAYLMYNTLVACYGDGVRPLVQARLFP